MEARKRRGERGRASNKFNEIGRPCYNVSERPTREPAAKGRAQRVSAFAANWWRIGFMDLLCEKCLTDLELVQSCCESSISEFLAHQLCGEGISAFSRLLPRSLWY